MKDQWFGKANSNVFSNQVEMSRRCRKALKEIDDRLRKRCKITKNKEVTHG